MASHSPGTAPASSPWTSRRRRRRRRAGPEDYELAKPHPEPYLTGLKRLGATKEEALVVEDSARGLNSAVAPGIDCAIIHDFTKAHDFSQASYRIESLIELKDIILQAT
jgi:HAD superfamily hydrolase (TIGR01509 family)